MFRAFKMRCNGPITPTVDYSKAYPAHFSKRLPLRLHTLSLGLLPPGPDPFRNFKRAHSKPTNAAAAEMRERIGEAIEKQLARMPEDIHLQKQATLVHTAQITTIHSFCLNVIRNHFNTIDLDPSFRIAEEAELALMKSDTVNDLLERYY